jgi:hypothetical protein
MLMLTRAPREMDMLLRHASDIVPLPSGHHSQVLKQKNLGQKNFQELLSPEQPLWTKTENSDAMEPYS